MGMIFGVGDVFYTIGEIVSYVPFALRLLGVLVFGSFVLIAILKSFKR